MWLDGLGLGDGDGESSPPPPPMLGLVLIRPTRRSDNGGVLVPDLKLPLGGLALELGLSGLNPLPSGSGVLRLARLAPESDLLS